jgi:uncharacterized protein YjbI with pentapeptide repeats
MVEQPLQSSDITATDSGMPGPTLFESLETLQLAHTEFQQSQLANNSDPEHTDRKAEVIRSFIGRAQRTGNILTDRNERKAAQRIIDYWSSELVTLPRVTAKDFMPMLLEPPSSDRSAPSDTEPGDRSRDIIRFGAAARLWRDSGKKHGYLLFGEALVQGAKFSRWDPDIAALVAASEEAQKSDRRGRIKTWATASLSCAVLLFVVLQAHWVWIPEWSDKHVLRVNNALDYSTEPVDVQYAEIILPFLIALNTGSLLNRTGQLTSLRWLETYQPYMPPYQPNKPGRGAPNFSRARLANLDLSQLKLYAPKFVEAELFYVTLNEANLPNVSFSDSRITESHFDRASLEFGQFARAEIQNTSFVRANLYRATFNQAALCKVNFSEADLRKTWFREVEFDKGFAPTFKGAPWWLALGWSRDQIEALSNQSSGDVKDMASFQRDMKRTNDDLNATKPGTFDRAIALNVVAWTRATYGDIPKTPVAPSKIEPRCLKEGKLDEQDQKVCGRCLTSDDIPDNALDSAEQAICIVKSLNRLEGENASYDALENVFKDTLAYVLMQRDNKEEMKKAAMYLNAILNDPILQPPGESIFRNAVARFYLAPDQPDQKKETEEAIKQLKIAMGARDYVPSHELHTLNGQMQGEFWKELLGQIDTVNPAIKKKRCPP